MRPAWGIRIRTRPGLGLLLFKVTAELRVVFDINVGIALSDNAHDINVVGELDEADRLGNVSRRKGEEECDGDTEPEIGRAEEIVRVSTRNES